MATINGDAREGLQGHYYYTFPCMVFALCRLAGVPVWHINVIKTPPSTVGIGLIRDEANE